jgi:hypothetical protein
MENEVAMRVICGKELKKCRLQGTKQDPSLHRRRRLRRSRSMSKPSPDVLVEGERGNNGSWSALLAAPARRVTRLRASNWLRGLPRCGGLGDTLKHGAGLGHVVGALRQPIER